MPLSYSIADGIGPYMQVGKTYKRLMAHAAKPGLALVDHYIDEPTEVDRSQLCTNVMMPLR